ncbi:hypothetical protein GOBAR_DD07232 [Gossypium barbadense]|nr:hypothetical protein GOBAR_DD07232 [Gossypium barbadense]
MGVVKLDDSSGVENPLSNHVDKGVNMISGIIEKKIKANIAEVRTPLKCVWRKIVEKGIISSSLKGRCKETRNYYEFYHEEGYEIQKCVEFRALVQGIMDYNEVEFHEEVEEGGSICASEPTARVSKVNHHVVIISRPRNNEAGVPVM